MDQFDLLVYQSMDFSVQRDIKISIEISGYNFRFSWQFYRF